MNARLDDWSDLRTFLAVVRQGTLAGAGEALGVNASTVHRRMGRLEDDLDTRLFDRSPRGYSLTGAGEDLLEHAEQVEEEVLALTRRVGGRDASLQGEVRVATVHDLAHYVLWPIIGAFREAHPQVTVFLSTGMAFADLDRQEAHVALRFGPEPDHPDLVVKHVSTIDVALYASPDYLAAHGQPATRDELREHAVVRGGPRLARYPTETVLEGLVDPGRIAARGDDFLSRARALVEGLGIGYLGCFLGESEPGLQRLDLQLPEVTGTDLWMVVHVDLRRNARVRAFSDFVFEALVARRPLFRMPA